MSGKFFAFFLSIHRLMQSDQISLIWKWFDFHHLVTAIGKQGGHQSNEDRLIEELLFAMEKKV